MIFNNYHRFLFVFCVLLIVFGRTVFALEKVENYRETQLDCVYQNTQWLGLREMKLNGRATVFLVHTASLQTALTAKSNLSCVAAAADFYKNSNYEKLRSQASLHKGQLKNAGLKNFQSTGVFLTVDMCPSGKKYEKELFAWSLAKKVPLGIAITGRWISQHNDELQDLLHLQKQGVALTWINHTHDHPYTRGTANEQNFLLSEGVDIRAEVIGNEIAMIQNGLTPSVFFRFPGLISNQLLVEQILNWGLIPMGAEAWLAWGQKPKPGSIILVHGNGNEPRGIELFFEFLDQISRWGFKSIPGGH